jgi:hypothetical protein
MHLFPQFNLLKYLDKILEQQPNEYNSSTINVIDNGLDQSNDESVFAERAAILQYDGNLPQDWAEAIAAIELRQKPNTISSDGWQEIKQTFNNCLLPQIEQLIAHKWTIEQVFGCHKQIPENHYQSKGLLMQLVNKSIQQISQTGIIAINKNAQITKILPQEYPNANIITTLSQLP